jgi:Polymer-forming cytoskeletal
MASFFKPPRFLMRDRAAGRAVVPESRTVTCYRCALALTVSGYAESASCPHCAGLLRLLPLNITKGHWGSSIMTTESVHIHQDAKAIANIIVASGDILIEGSAHAMCICGGTARLAPTAELKGGVRAATLIIEPGATITGSIVESPSTALGSIDVDAAARSRPGTGPGAQIEFKHAPLAIAASQIIEPKDHQPIPIRPPTPARPPRLRVVR